MPLIRERLGGHEASRADDLDSSHRAAVAAILRERNGSPEVMLIRRAERVGDPWSGHMAFPGGRRQGSDADLLATAVRETQEEVGLDLGQGATVLGRLDDVPAIGRGRSTGMTVTPYVFELGDDDLRLAPNHEVSEILWAPLSPLFRGELATTLDYPYEGQTLTFPAWSIDGRIVWGLTYRMLDHLFAVVEPSYAARFQMP